MLGPPDPIRRAGFKNARMSVILMFLWVFIIK